MTVDKCEQSCSTQGGHPFVYIFSLTQPPQNQARRAKITLARAGTLTASRAHNPVFCCEPSSAVPAGSCELCSKTHVLRQFVVDSSQSENRTP